MVKQRAVRPILITLIILIALAACDNGASALLPTPTSASSDDAIPPYQPTISVPSNLNLKGTLILSDYHQGIFRLNFSTGTLTPVFHPAPNSFLSSAVLSPNRQTFALVYSPPHEDTDPAYGVESLYTLPADGSGDPKPLLKVIQNNYYYFSPWWSPDGQSIYYGRLVSPPLGGTPVSEPTGYFLTRYAFPNGPAQDLRRDVLAVRLSADGKQLFTITLDPATTFSNIDVSQPDGSSPQDLLPGGESWIIDSLAVSPDGQSVVFSSADKTQTQSSSSWLERLMGVGVAQAHAVPSDLWIVTAGQDPRQLTTLANNAFIEDWSPDGQYIVFSCGVGIFLIRPDGTGLTPVVSEPVFASLQWLP